MRIARLSALKRTFSAVLLKFRGLLPTIVLRLRFRRYAFIPRSRVALALLSFAFISTGNLHAQVLQPPSDPLEPVTGRTEVLTTPEQRQPAIDLLTRVQRNFGVTMSGAPYTMKVSFTASGNTEYEGEGTMEVLEALPDWSWTVHIAGISPTRVGTTGFLYGSADPVPLRIQMLRSFLFRPVPGFPNQKAIRTATTTLNGVQVTCVLLSGSVAKAAPPRSWWDREYCVDANTGLLHLASEAQGIYAIYDYENAIQFHGHVIPRNIKVVEGGATVLDIHVDSMEDGVAEDQAALKPTPEMISHGPSYPMGSPEWAPIRVDPNPHGPLQKIETVMVHAAASHDEGKVLEAEAVQNSDPVLAAKAIEVVKQTSFPAAGLQRDLFVAVEFFIRQD
jgi:hypothetical protein